MKIEKFKAIYEILRRWMDGSGSQGRRIYRHRSGEIRMDCYYPRDLKGGETVTISSEGEILATL